MDIWLANGVDDVDGLDVEILIAVSGVLLYKYTPSVS